MAWLACNKNGTENISQGIMERDNFGQWMYIVDTGLHLECQQIQLSHGSIHKLIGRNLTWEYEPVELK